MPRAELLDLMGVLDGYQMKTLQSPKYLQFQSKIIESKVC